MKLLASIHSPQELEYLIKTAKAIGLDCIVVVASAAQLLDIIQNVQGISIISITNRNHYIWKIDRGKAARILNNPDVAKVLHAWLAADENRVILEEGFSCKDDIKAVNRNLVNFVLLGEELLSGKEELADEDIGESVKQWIS